jgi:hypothetical protein
MRSLNLLNSNLLLRPDKTAAQFKNGDARIWRIPGKEGRIRSTPFNENMGNTMKKILLRMN